MAQKVDHTALGRRIRKLRKRARLTQDELAQCIGISLSFLGHIERGTRITSVDTLVRLSNELHTPVDFLLQESLELKQHNAG